MKIFKIFAFTAAAAFAFACGSDQAANDQNTANAGNTSNQASQASPAPAEPTMGPAATLKALSEASQKKDIEGIKRYLSKGTLDRLEEGAKEQKKTADELLREENGAPFPKVPELGKEEISGDTATLEVKNTETNEFEKLPFVKEDGMWKVAIDKYLDDLDSAAADAAGEDPAPKRP